jgi:hypothetical protein
VERKYAVALVLKLLFLKELDTAAAVFHIGRVRGVQWHIRLLGNHECCHQPFCSCKSCVPGRYQSLVRCGVAALPFEDVIRRW